MTPKKTKHFQQWKRCQPLHTHHSTLWRSNIQLKEQDGKHIFDCRGTLYSITLWYQYGLYYKKKWLIYSRCARWNILFGWKGRPPRTECSHFMLSAPEWMSLCMGMFSIKNTMYPMNKKANVCVCFSEWMCNSSPACISSQPLTKKWSCYISPQLIKMCAALLVKSLKPNTICAIPFTPFSFDPQRILYWFPFCCTSMCSSENYVRDESY